MIMAAINKIILEIKISEVGARVSGSEYVFLLQRVGIQSPETTLNGSQLPVTPALGYHHVLLAFRDIYTHIDIKIHNLNNIYVSEIEDT